MKVALVGTRGVPARYGGFETAVEEIGRRLCDQGLQVRVYCRNDPKHRPTHLGMDLVHLPAVHHRYLETLSHTFLSVLHLLWRPCDVAILFNGANSILVPLLLVRGIPTAVHVDGIESKRGKWSRLALAWHRLGERLAVRWANEVVADAVAIQDYYAENYGATTTLLTYGAPILEQGGSERIRDLGLESQGYHLVVARFERENNVHLLIEGYRKAQIALPLVVVGAHNYPSAYDLEIEAAHSDDPQVRMLGSVWDQATLDELYANAATYLHGHSVGGTNPSLLRAMGAGVPVLAIDVPFTREVLGAEGRFFNDVASVAELLRTAEGDPAEAAALGRRGRERARTVYRWDVVADGYVELCRLLAQAGPRARPASGPQTP